MDRDIYMTDFDSKRLTELVQVGITFKGKDSEYLQRLEQELDRAHVVEPTAIPHDVITMNSRVRLLDLYTGEERLCALVFPVMPISNSTRFQSSHRLGRPCCDTELETRSNGKCLQE